MAAFTGGVSRTHKEYTPQAQDKYKRNDIFATITDYDLSRATIRVKDDEGRVMHVSIDPDTVIRNNESNAKKDIVAEWFGHLIDAAMAKNLKPGARIVLESANFAGKATETDGEKIYPMRATRIINVPNPEPEKAFKGFFTLDTININTDKDKEGIKTQRIVSVQSWDEEAVLINDKAGLDNIRKRIENSLSEYGKIYNLSNGEEMAAVVPTIGVQFRVRHANSEKNATSDKEEFVVVDTSGCFDWIPAPRDEQGKVLTGAKGHPLDVENFNNWVEGYQGHIKELFGEEAKNLVVEVCAYKNYAASPKSGYLKLSSSDKAPLNILANTITRLSKSESDEDNLARGKNWIVNGIVQISPNSLQKVAGVPTEIPRNYVQRLHANGLTGHVHSWVRAAGGGKCVPHEALKRVQKDKPAPPNSASSAQNEAPDSDKLQSQSHQESKVPLGTSSKPENASASAASTQGEDWNPFDDKPNDEASASLRRAPGK